jgi:nucleoside-triphosphatase THEP1
MTEPRIYILTGEIGEGKTTALQKWAGGIHDVGGILSLVADGKRLFLDLGSKDIFPMEAGADEKNILAVGKFLFSRNSFDKAIDILRKGIGKTKWLLLDEIGPLELRGEGFYDVIKEMIQANNREQKILLVVRQSLVNEVIEYFHINRSELLIINKASLMEERFT